MKQFKKYLQAKHFFPGYAKGVKNFKHKMRGKDGNGNPIEFSEEDRREIKAGVKVMAAEILKSI